MAYADVERHLSEIETALREHRQLSKDRAFLIDNRYLPSIIDLANRERPGLNASVVSDPQQLRLAVDRLLEDGVDSARFVVGAGAGCSHYAAVDYRMKDGKVSLVFIEPTRTRGGAQSMLIYRAMTAFASQPVVTRMVIEGDMQKSNVDCTSFSLSLAKKMFKEREHFDQIHARNLKGEFAIHEGVVRGREADRLLPPSLMKHTQSRDRLKQYLKNHPGAKKARVNKKAENLEERLKRHHVSGHAQGGRPHYINSIEDKRVRELRRLLASLGEGASASAAVIDPQAAATSDGRASS